MSARRTKKRSQAAAADQVAGTGEFDREMIAESFGTPTAVAKRRWTRARRKVGRPRQGLGAQVISVSVERALLERSDALARRMGVSRAGLIARGLKAVLAVEGDG